MQRGNFSSARSGGDALKRRECQKALLTSKDENSCRWNWTAGNETAKIDKHGAGQTEWIDKIASCPTYYPTEEEFVDPLRYLQKIAPEASEYGICKIIPPVVSTVPAGVVLMKEKSNFKFTTRVQPMRLSNWDKDDKAAFPMSGNFYTLTEYEKVANKAFARKFSTAAVLPTKFVEAEFWKELVAGRTRTVEYACDVEGSAFSESSTDPLGQSKWNLKAISRLPDSTLRLLDVVIPGVTEPMLYIGMLFSMFAWHIEDHYLYSINYHHCGAPKTWYGVPGMSAPAFENIVERHVYDSELLKDAGKGSHYDFLLGKTTMFAPKLLSEHGVPVFRAVQNPGEFVITFPRSYHAGFSHGFNCGEAVNFAMADWFPFGAAACARYAHLNRIPLLTHDELICKEAITISLMSLQSSDMLIRRQHRHTKVAFVTLIRSRVQSLESLKKLGAKVITSSMMNVPCGLCKHACYISYTMCSCYADPMCLNHERVFDVCSCGTGRSLIVRDNFATLQSLSQAYEMEGEVVDEVVKGPLVSDSFVATAGVSASEELLLQKLLSSVRDNGPVEASSLEETTRYSDAVDVRTKSFNGTTSLDGRPLCEEDSSDSEAFRVKRRRILPSHRKRFQVDEQVLSPKGACSVQIAKFSVNMLSTGFQSRQVSGKRLQLANEVSLEKERQKVSLKERPLLVRDVIDKLGIKGSRAEVIAQWQRDARHQGLILKIKNVPYAGRLEAALPLKSCLQLKRILTEDQAKKFQSMVQAVNPFDRLGNKNNTDEEPKLIAPHEKKSIVAKKDAFKNISGSIPAIPQVHQEVTSENDVVDFSSKLVVLQRKKNIGSGSFNGEGSLNDTELPCIRQFQKITRLKVKGPTPPQISPSDAGKQDSGDRSDNTNGIGRSTVRNTDRSTQQCVDLSESQSRLNTLQMNRNDTAVREDCPKGNLTEDYSNRRVGDEFKTLVVYLNRKVKHHQKSRVSETKRKEVEEEANSADGSSWSKSKVSTCTGDALLENPTINLMGSCSVTSVNRQISSLPSGHFDEDRVIGSMFREDDNGKDNRDTRDHINLQHASSDLLLHRAKSNGNKFMYESVSRNSVKEMSNNARKDDSVQHNHGNQIVKGLCSSFDSDICSSPLNMSDSHSQCAKIAQHGVSNVHSEGNSQQFNGLSSRPSSHVRTNSHTAQTESSQCIMYSKRAKSANQYSCNLKRHKSYDNSGKRSEYVQHSLALSDSSKKRTKSIYSANDNLSDGTVLRALTPNPFISSKVHHGNHQDSIIHSRTFGTHLCGQNGTGHTHRVERL
ncbi:hypothetical protein KP509_04G112300 [Ceratopteris richardii]|uniref:Uncharacterized protein n=1 Tax=Ceratopteris richardii TaxID=49495 RepID=A0A8T2UWK5_CERRI|nr:hypothetical protein KP509_04G112300 [Ceratopteris richardii]